MAAATEPERPASATAERAGGAAGQPQEAGDQQQRRAEAQQQRQPPAARLLDGPGIDEHVVLVEQRLEARVGELRPYRLELRRGARILLVGRELARLFEHALDDVRAAGDLRHVVGADLLFEERVRDVDALLRALGQEHLHQQIVQHEHQDEADPPWARPHQAWLGRIALAG